MIRKPSRTLAAVTPALLASLLTACSPEVGSDRWCKDMDAKSKGEWSVNDAADYTKHCVLGLKPAK